MSSSGQDVDYFAVLEVSRNCSDDEVKQAYRKLARRWHPDKNPGNKAEAEKKFKLISEAYQVLSEKSQRESYIKYGRNVFSGTASSYQFHSASELFKEFFADDPFLADLLEDLDSRSHKRAQRRKPSDYTFSSSRSDATGTDSYLNQSADDLFRAHFGDNPLYKEFFGDAASTGKTTKTEGPDTSKSHLEQQNGNLNKDAGPELKPEENDTSFPATRDTNHDNAKFTQKSMSEGSQAGNVRTSATERKRNGDIDGPQVDARNDKSKKSQAGDDKAHAAETKRYRDEQTHQTDAGPDCPERSRASNKTASAAETKRSNGTKGASTAEGLRASDAEGREKDTGNDKSMKLQAGNYEACVAAEAKRCNDGQRTHTDAWSRSGHAEPRGGKSQDFLTSSSLASDRSSTLPASSPDKKFEATQFHMEQQQGKHDKALSPDASGKNEGVWAKLKEGVQSFFSGGKAAGTMGSQSRSADFGSKDHDQGSSSLRSAQEVHSQKTTCIWCEADNGPTDADHFCCECENTMCGQCAKKHIQLPKHHDIRLIK